MLRFFRTEQTVAADAELVAKYKSTNEQKYLGQLYDRYLELVYGVCLKYLKDQTLAEDAIIAIYEELITKVREHDIRQFRSWLHVLVKNHCLMQLRRDKKNITVSFDPNFMQSIEELHPLLEEGQQNGQEAALKVCLDKLKIEQKSCIKLFYYEGKSYKEIAEMRVDEVGTIRSYIQNGRRNLRKCLEKKNKAHKGEVE
ncbi:MAG: DNA-directed RNA polymerase sigma-70 factor [Saprospiraceae bacterium]|nr:MAG: DNA-directed RNA polymerase sigma-70 factor [Saprospiraceae bacterium]